MVSLSSSHNLLRSRSSHGDNKVSFAELFFDLVFVFAITQISHTLLAHFDLAGMAQAMFLLMALWWVWIFTSWVTNWVDPAKTPVRLMLYALMLAGLVLSMSTPQAFGDRGIVFALAYVFMQVGRSLFMCWALHRHDAANFRNFIRITLWLAFSGLFWIAGGLAGPEGRFAFWGVALLIEYCGPAFYFRVPGLGRSTTRDWNISAEHFAERCGLFVIIALGESILVTGGTFGGMGWDLPHTAAFLSAFAGTVAMWWIYFSAGAERAGHRFAGSDDPGKIARLAYTYIHIVIVAGIVLCAVADELALAHPLGHSDFKTAAVILGGPALYLLGSLLFRKALLGNFSVSHLAGIFLHALLLPFYSAAPLILGCASTVILIAVAAWDTCLSKS